MSLDNVEQDGSNDEERISISITRYKQLMDDARFYQCLQMAGVDNWEGYDEAVELYENE